MAILSRLGAVRSYFPATLLARTQVAATLAGWLGPWSDEQAAARGVLRQHWRLGEIDVTVYRPDRRQPLGHVFVCPGLHFAGANEPKMDRFLRALAAAGVQTTCAMPPGFRSLRLVASDLETTRRAFEWAVARSAGRIGVMSISFGSRFALELASDPRCGGLLCFGGYASWQAAMRFAVGLGPEVGERDPLNRPVVFGQVAEHFGLDPDDVRTLRSAWLRYCIRTWGREPLKRQGRHVPVARSEAETLPSHLLPLFLEGCAVDPACGAGVSASTAPTSLAAAIDLAAPAHQWLDPRASAARVTCPTWLVHGVDDDVIPVSQVDALAQLLPNAQTLQVVRTGLYGHTAGARPTLPSLAAELRGFVKVLQGFASIAAG